MLRRRIGGEAGARRLVLHLDAGDDLIAALTALADDEAVDTATLDAAGSLADATLSAWDFAAGGRTAVPVEGPVEVASFTGIIALDAHGRPAFHLDAVLGRRDGTALVGRLTAGRAARAVELVVTERPAPTRAAP